MHRKSSNASLEGNKKDQSVRSYLITLTIARLLVNTTRRFPYPFLPAISKELNVPLVDMERIIAVQSGVGVSSSLFGPLLDRYGRRVFILGALSLFTFAGLIGAIRPQFGTVFVTFTLWGIAKAVYDPAMQAYLADHTPYSRRALAIGFSELSWAGALIIGAPLAGYLLDTSGLAAVFWVLSVASMVMLILLILKLSPDAVKRSSSSVRISIKAHLMTLWSVLKKPAVLGAITCTFLFTVGNETFFIVYGTWMESSFALGLAVLGFATGVISLAEIAGDGVVISLADRVGKRRMLLIGLLFTAIGYLITPYLTWNLLATLVGLFLTFLFFEITFVVSLSMFTEISLEARGTIMSNNIAADRLGRFIGALLGGYLYLWGGFRLNGFMSMVLSIAAFIIICLFVAEVPSMTVPGIKTVEDKKITKENH